MFEYIDGKFYFLNGGETKLIEIPQINSKFLVETDVFKPMSFLPGFVNSMINALNWITTFIFSIFAKTYQILSSSQGGVDGVIIETLNKNSQLFQTLFNNIVPYAFISLLMYALYMQVKRQGSALKIILVGFLTMGAIRVIYLPMSTGQSGQSETSLSRIYTNVSEIFEEVGKEASNGLAGETEEGVMVSYFKNSLWMPYQAMNADRQDDGSYNLTDIQLYELLSFEGEEEFKLSDSDGKEKAIDDIVGTKKEPKIKMFFDLGNKFIFSFIMLSEVILLGLVITGFYIFALFCKAIILMIFIGLPFILAAALFPFFSNILFNTGKTLLTLTVIPSMVGILSVLFMMFNTQIQSFYLQIFNNDLVLTYLFKALTYFILWKCRRELLSLLEARTLPQATRILNRFGDNGKTIINNGLERVQKPAIGSLLLANGALRTAGGRVKPGLERMKQGVSDTRFNKSVQKRMANGESFELATLETAKGIEEKRIQRKQPMQTLSTMKHKTRALYHDLMEKGYVGIDSEKQAEHASKSLQSKNKLNELRVSKEGARQKVNVLNQAIDKHVKKQGIPKPSASDPIFVDFRKRGSVTNHEPLISTVGRTHQTVKEMPKTVESTISQKINHSTLSRSPQVTQKPVNQSSLQTVIRKTPRVVRKAVMTENEGKEKPIVSQTTVIEKQVGNFGQLASRSGKQIESKSKVVSIGNKIDFRERTKSLVHNNKPKIKGRIK
ncbi:hypothetical protein ACJBY2_03285 [Streptococcus suis]|uniref:hypothetical protein n=1 Tax=Streptococcus suis TaxID=1307 RepID=UPI00201B0B36|nr:hypothetical protein [Streptococcus suis]MCL4881182.1 hypothetical protein [Streptococcus suis]